MKLLYPKQMIASLKLCSFTLVFSIATSSNVNATIIISDTFDDGVLGTNTSGVGNGFSTENSTGVTPLETGGGAVIDHLDSPAGSTGSTFFSNDQFDAASSITTTTTFVISEFGRFDDSINFTTRQFIGLSDGGAPAGTGVTSFLTNANAGLFVVLNSDDQFGATNLPIGGGGVYYTSTDTGPIIELGTFTYDSSLVTVGTPGSAGRGDRAPVDLLQDLTVTIETDVDGFSVAFSAAGGATAPGTIAGDFSDFGITNQTTVLDTASAFVAQQGDGDSRQFIVDSITVEQIPEPTSIALFALGGVFGLARRRRA